MLLINVYFARFLKNSDFSPGSKRDPKADIMRLGGESLLIRARRYGRLALFARNSSGPPCFEECVTVLLWRLLGDGR